MHVYTLSGCSSMLLSHSCAFNLLVGSIDHFARVEVGLGLFDWSLSILLFLLLYSIRTWAIECVVFSFFCVVIVILWYSDQLFSHG